MLSLLLVAASSMVQYAGPLTGLIKALPSSPSLACEASLGKETVIVCYDTSRIPDLKAELARTFVASWKMIDGVPTLERTPDQRSEVTARSIRFRESEFGRILDSFSVGDSEDQWFRSGVSSMARFRDDIDTKRYELVPNYMPPLELPADLALRASLRAMGASVLAHLPVGQTVVFSSVPSAAQRPFTPAMISILKRVGAVEDRLQKQHEMQWSPAPDWQHYWNEEIRASMSLPLGPKANPFVTREPATLNALYATYTPGGDLRSFGISHWGLDLAVQPSLAGLPPQGQTIALTPAGAAQLGWMLGDRSKAPWPVSLDDPVADDPLGAAVCDGINGLA